MPIDLDSLKTGKIENSMAEAVKKFLQTNRDKAYLATELFEAVKGRRAESYVDSFEIRSVLYTLTKERSIISRFLETKHGFQAYYSTSET